MGFLQIASSPRQIEDFLRGTLLYVQQQQLCVQTSLEDVAQRCVHMLMEKGLVTAAADSHGPGLQVTELGRATFKGKSGTRSGTVPPEGGAAVTHVSLSP